MKAQLNVLKKSFQKFIRDESGQGTTEYILILVVVVAIGIVFKGRITTIVNAQIEKISQGFTNINPT